VGREALQAEAGEAGKVKPRLYYKHGLWRCWTLVQKDDHHFTYRSGLGWTKRDAYDDWRAQ
jgi:hypothetical protein